MPASSLLFIPATYRFKPNFAKESNQPSWYKASELLAAANNRRRDLDLPAISPAVLRDEFPHCDPCFRMEKVASYSLFDSEGRILRFTSTGDGTWLIDAAAKGYFVPCILGNKLLQAIELRAIENSLG